MKFNKITIEKYHLDKIYSHFYWDINIIFYILCLCIPIFYSLLYKKRN